MDTYWTGPQVAQIIGVSYDTLDYWVKRELVTPSLMFSHSIKKRCYFSLANVIAAAALKALRDRGISLQKIKKAQKEFCRQIGMGFEQGLQGGVIVADGDDLLTVLYTLDDAVQIMSLLKGGQMILPLDTIVSDVEERIALMFGNTNPQIPKEAALEEVQL